MNLARKYLVMLTAVLLAVGLAACSGGGGGGRVARFVVTANFDGSLSVFRATGNPRALDAQSAYDTKLSAVRAVLTASDGQTLYALGDDGSSGVVQVLTLDRETGRISNKNMIRVNRGVAAGVLSPDGRNLYVASGTQNGLSQLGITANGLEVIAPNPAGDPLTNVALHPSSTLLYTLGRDTHIVQAFMRNPASGELTAGPTLTLDDPPTAIAFNRSGTAAYISVDRDSDNVRVYDVNAITGALAFRKTFSAGDGPIAITVDAAGAYAYVANTRSSNVTVFSIDAATGDLGKLQTVSGGSAPQELRIDPTGATLYSADFSSASLTSFAVDPTTGQLSEAEQVRGRSGIYGLAVAPGSAYAQQVARYALAPASDGIHVYRVTDAQGTLAPEATDKVGSGLVDAVVDPVHNVVYAVAQDNQVRSYPFGSRPTSFSTVSVDTDAVLGRVVLEPSGQYLFALDERSVSGLSGRIYVFRIGANGALEAVQTRATGRNPENLVVHPAGRYLYSIDSYGDTITLFELNLSSGVLSQKQTFTPGRTGTGRGRPITMAFHPNGRYAYVTLEDDREIVRFHINDGNGFLESPQRLSTTSVGSDGRPRYIAVHPDGKRVTATFWGDTVATFTVNDNFTLSAAETIPVTQHPSYIAIDPQGGFAYVTVKDGTVRLPISASGALGTPDPTLTGSGDSSFSRAVTIVSDLR